MASSIIINSHFQVKRGHFSIPVFIPTDVQEMIKGMITVDPEKRITVKYTISLSQLFKSISIINIQSQLYDLYLLETKK